MLDQDFVRQDYPMSQPHLDSNPLGMNTDNRKTAPSDSIPVGTKSPNPNSSSLPTDLPGDPDPEPPLPDSPKKYNESNDSNSSKS